MEWYTQLAWAEECVYSPAPLKRSKTLPASVRSMTLNSISGWGFDSAALEDVEYPLISIVPWYIVALISYTY